MANSKKSKKQLPDLEQASEYEEQIELELASALDDETLIGSDTTLGAYLRQISQISLLSAEQEVELAKRIEAALFCEEMLAEKKTIDNKTRLDLEWMVEDGSRARQHLIEVNLRLVVWIANRFQSPTMGLDDLIQEGNIGLMTAVDKFDYTKGYKFSTYAVWWIRQTIVRAIEQKERIVRLPVNKHQKVNQFHRARRRLFNDLGRSPSYSELSTELDWTLEDVEYIEKLAQEVVYIDDDADITAFLQTRESSDPEDDFPSGSRLDWIDTYNDANADLVAFEVQDALASELESMSELEVNVMTMRMGLGTGNPMPFNDIAKTLDIPEKTVQEVTDRVLKRLRNSEALRDILD